MVNRGQYRMVHTMDYAGFENEPLVEENIKPFHKIKIPTTTPSEFLSNLVIFGKNV